MLLDDTSTAFDSHPAESSAPPARRSAKSRPRRATRSPGPEAAEASSELARYLAEIRHLPLLTRSEEVALAERIGEHAEAFRSRLCALPSTAGYAVARWRELRESGHTTATLSARWRDPNAGDPGPQIDRCLGRVAGLLDQGRSSGQRACVARELQGADLAMRVFEDAWKALGQQRPRSEVEHRRRREIAAHYAAHLEAKNEFVRRNLKLVVHLAKSFRGMGVPFLDLIQEGNLGLIRAVEKFDAARGFKFSTYAAWWIKQSFIRAVQYQSRTVRLPGHVYDLAIRESRARDAMTRSLGREPGREELAQELGIDEADLEALHSATLKIASLADESSGREDETRADSLLDGDAIDPVHAVHAVEIAPEISQLVARLAPRERQIVRLRYGLEDGETRTLQQIGEVLGLSRERVRQIELAALAKMREIAEPRGLGDAIDDRSDTGAAAIC